MGPMVGWQAPRYACTYRLRLEKTVSNGVRCYEAKKQWRYSVHRIPYIQLYISVFSCVVHVLFVLKTSLSNLLKIII